MESQKCPACGGDLVFDPQKQMLRCVQCKTLSAIKKITTTEKSFEKLLREAPLWKKDTVVYQCKSCGAKAVLKKGDLAVKCDYCCASNIVPTQDLAGICPDTVVPFQLNKDEAINRARHWLSRKFFAPRWYKKNVNAQNVGGVYYPAFTFDAKTNSLYTGMQVITQERTIYVNDKAVTQTYTTRRPISGECQKTFDDLLISATNSVPEAVFRALEPYHTNAANVYQKEFLSGYTASHYTKDALQCWDEAKSVMERAIRKEITARYGVVENLQVRITLSDITYKYLLLPMYIGHSEYKDKKYEFYVNGQTGKVHGKSPVSFWKAFFWTMFGALTTGGLILLAIFLNGRL